MSLWSSYIFIYLVVVVRGRVKNVLYFIVDLFFMSSCSKLKIGKLCDISWWRAVSKDLPSPQNPSLGN